MSTQVCWVVSVWFAGVAMPHLLHTALLFTQIELCCRYHNRQQLIAHSSCCILRSHTLTVVCFWSISETYVLVDCDTCKHSRSSQVSMCYAIAFCSHLFNGLAMHRLAPLSEGRVEGGTLNCSYHGWKFDSQGKCVDIPQVSSQHGSISRLEAHFTIISSEKPLKTLHLSAAAAWHLPGGSWRCLEVPSGVCSSVCRMSSITTPLNSSRLIRHQAPCPHFLAIRQLSSCSILLPLIHNAPHLGS